MRKVERYAAKEDGGIERLHNIRLRCTLVFHECRFVAETVEMEFVSFYIYIIISVR